MIVLLNKKCAPALLLSRRAVGYFFAPGCGVGVGGWFGGCVDGGSVGSPPS